MIQVGAHRGYSGRAPENTLIAFDMAIKAGADLIEFDVQLTRDRIPVVIHDEWIDRTSNGHGRVIDLTWAELKQFDYGSYRGIEYAGCSIPTLDEVLDLAAGRCLINLEIKNGPVYYPGIEKLVINRVAAHNCREQVIISSFDHPAIDRCCQLDPGIKLAYLISHLPGRVGGWLPGYPLFALHPYYAYVTADLVKECHQLGLKVNVWGTNNPADWDNLAGFGVDTIISDYVSELKSWSAKMR